MRKRLLLLAFLSVLTVFLCAPAMAAGTKFVRAYRDNNYDMYINKVNIIQNQGVISFWVKSVYSEQGKALVKKELPQKYRKKPIEYGMDFFVFNTKKNKYNIKFASVCTDGKEIYRQGSKKWLPVKDRTIAAALIDKVNNFIAEKNDD